MIDVFKECEQAGRIGITGHTNPDGDCVGSTLATWQFLTRLYPNKDIVVLLEKPAPIFDFIEGADKIIYMDDEDMIPDGFGDEPFDVMYVLDTVIDRTGNAQKYIKDAKKVINIDHHISNSGEGDISIVKPKASACAEVVYQLIAENPEYKKLIDCEIAQTIYTGIIHDCGVMQYSNTSPTTLRIVADLVEFGFDFPKLIDETFYEKTYVQSQILGRALLEAFPIMDGFCMVSMVDRKTMAFYGADKKDLSGIVNQIRIIKGVEVAIFLYETGPQEFKVSLRSGGKIDVSAVSAYFGGGGHVRAAGCTINGSFHDVVNNVTARIALQMEA